MISKFVRHPLVLFASFWLWLPVCSAADSYRFLHVTIDTPWMIFLGLLVVVLSPFVLMAILHWYFAYKKSQEEKAESSAE